MPRLNKVSLVDKKYSQVFLSKSEDFTIAPELSPGELVFDVNVADTYPEVSCTPIDYDCNWFLASGVIRQEIPTCQLGRLNPMSTTPQVESIGVIFPGSVTYEVRPGKILRQGMKCWIDNTNTFLEQ